MLGTNNVSNYCLFSDLDFVFPSSVAPRTPQAPLPPPALHPIPTAPSDQGQMLAGLDSHKQFDGGEFREAWKTGGAEQFALAELGAELQPEATRPRG